MLAPPIHDQRGMDTAAVLRAFDAEVRRGLGPDGTGAMAGAADPVVRRLAGPGHAGSGVFWSDLDARSAPAVIADQVAFFAARGERFEWKLYDYDQPAGLAALLVQAGLVPAEPEAMMVAVAQDAAARLATAAPPAGVRLVRVTGEAGVAALLDVHRRAFGSNEPGLRESVLSQLTTARSGPSWSSRWPGGTRSARPGSNSSAGASSPRCGAAARSGHGGGAESTGPSLGTGPPWRSSAAAGT
jgi:hypothetical protein